MYLAPCARRYRATSGMGRVVETHRPAEHVQLVHCARADRIRTVFDEQLDDREVAALGGKMNRVRVVPLISDVRVGAAVEQRPHNRFVPHAEMQRRPQAGIAGQRPAFVDDARMFVEDCGDDGDASSAAGRGE